MGMNMNELANELESVMNRRGDYPKVTFSHRGDYKHIALPGDRSDYDRLEDVLGKRDDYTIVKEAKQMDHKELDASREMRGISDSLSEIVDAIYKSGHDDIDASAYCDETVYAIRGCEDLDSIISYRDEGIPSFSEDVCANAVFAVLQNRVPLLVGESGVGKTYIASNLSRTFAELCAYRAGWHEGIVRICQFEFDCSTLEYSDIWRKSEIRKIFKAIFEEAYDNTENLYYVFLDNYVDSMVLRANLSQLFSNIKSLPSNMIVIAAGEASRDIHDDMFAEVHVKNVLNDLDSDEANEFFDNLKSSVLEDARDRFEEDYDLSDFEGFLDRVIRFVKRVPTECYKESTEDVVPKHLIPKGVVDFVSAAWYAYGMYETTMKKYYLSDDNVSKLVRVASANPRMGIPISNVLEVWDDCKEK